MGRAKGRHRKVEKSQKALGTLHHFWRRAALPIHWELRIYNADVVPMIVYGMESAALTNQDLHRIEAFHSQSVRKMHRIPSTYYTKIFAPDIPTTTNRQLRQQTSQPPLTHYIHRAQLKRCGHILRASEQYGAVFTQGLLFTKAFVFRGRVAGEGFRRGRHWVEQCAVQACHWVQELPSPPISKHPKFPFAFVELHRLAVPRALWSRLMGLPTCRKHLKQTSYSIFSQCLRSESTEKLGVQMRSLPKKSSVLEPCIEPPSKGIGSGKAHEITIPYAFFYLKLQGFNVLFSSQPIDAQKLRSCDR